MDRQGREGLAERREELDAIAAAVDDVRSGSGRLMVVEGPAGIGKTALLDAARGIAEHAALQVFVARGTELESDFGFGVVRQLFERRLDDADRDMFNGPARFAAPLLGVKAGVDDHDEPTPEEATSAVMRGLHWLTINLTHRGPVALMVDDAHWADAASLRVLSYLAGRLERVRVLLLVASRPADEAPAPVAALRQSPDAVVLRPAPLSEDAAGRVVRGAVPDAPLQLCRACHEVTGGNPFFLRELTRLLRASGAPAATDVRELVPASVTDAVALRIGRLPPSARELARATALLGGTEVLVRHAAVLAELDGEGATAADLLSGAGIVYPTRPLSFVHPIVQAAVYRDIPAGRRAQAHARAALLLAAEDASAELVAAHLLATEPAGDAWVCEQLVGAASLALARGAPEAATAALRRALLEPPAPSERPAMLISLGTAEMLALDSQSAVEHLQRGIKTLAEPEPRLRAALLLAGLLAGAARVQEGVEVLEDVLARGLGRDPRLVGHVEGQLVSIALLTPLTRRRVTLLEARLRRRVEEGREVGAAELTAVAAGMAQAGESASRTAEVALKAVDQLRRAQSLPMGAFSVSMLARGLMGADRLDEAIDFADGLVAAARRRGSDYDAIPALQYAAEARVRSGALVRAETDARASLELAGDAWRAGIPAMASVVAAILLERGQLEQARGTLENAGILGPAALLSPAYPVTMALHLRGRIRLAGGDAAGAAADLTECGRRLCDYGESNPAFINWRSGAAAALSQLGEHRAARQLAEEELRLARRFGAPRAIALSLLCRAPLQKREAQLADVREAVSVLDGSPARLARAHALGDLGAALLARGEREAARETLREAAELAQLCGSTALTDRVLGDLRRTGARPRRTARTGPEALTPSEHRVAALAARGVPNRDIAERLVVTTRTIEYHLSATYRKLGIHTRAELEPALASPSHDPPGVTRPAS